MEFHGMKRKALQALCKKHGVPANLTNHEMADRLASMFKENEEPVSLEKLSTNPKEIGSENEAKVVKKQAKKVRFSPENQTIVYEVSVYRRPGRRSRKQILSKNPAQVIENDPNNEDIRKADDCQVRVTRSRVQDAVEDDANMVFMPPVWRKRGRRGMKTKDAEVNNNGKSEVLEMGDRDDVKNGNDEVTGGISRWQLRSRKNGTQEDSKNIRKSERGDKVHLMDGSSKESDVVPQDVKSKNGPKQSTRNARKEDQSVALSSEVEKVEVVSRVTRQSRAQTKDVASMVKTEVKIVGEQRGCEEVLQLKEPQKGRGKNASRQNAVAQRVNAENSLLAVEGAEAEKPLRRSKRNAEKGCAKSATAVQTEAHVTKVQEQSEGDIALEEPPECLRRYSSRRKSVLPQSGKGEKEDNFTKKENRKRTRTTDLDAIVEYSGELQRTEYAFTSQDQAPLRRSRRKTAILNAPAPMDAELAKKEGIGKMQQLRAPFLEKDVTKELPRKSSRNASIFNSSGTSQEDQIAVAQKDWEVKQQGHEPILEEEKTSVIEHHLVTEIPQRRSTRITSRSASMAPPYPTAKVVKKKRQSKSRMTIIEEEDALSESLPAPEELPAGKDDLVVAEGAGNKYDLDLNVSKQAVKNSDECSNKKRQGLRGNSGATKQCGFGEASPLFLDMEECRDSTGNIEETLLATSVKLVDLSTDQEMQQSAHKSMVVYEKESNLVGGDRQKLVHGANVESEVNCMSCQSVNTKCVLDDPNCSDPKLLEFESNVCYVVDSSEVTFPAESQGREMSDQEMKEDTKPIDTHSVEESLVTHREDKSPVESDKERLVQVDTVDSETNHNQSSGSPNGRGAVDDPNFFESRLVEIESNHVNMDSSEMTSLANGLSLADQTGVIGPAGGENTSFASDHVNDDDSRTPFTEDHILVEIKDTNVTALESVRGAIFKDHLNEFGENSGLKRGLENTLKRAEEVIATDSSNKEGTPHIECSVRTTENQESSAEFYFATAETGAQKITEVQQSTYSNTATPESPYGPAPENQDKTQGIEAAVDTAGSGMSDQERSVDLHPGNAQCVHESVIIYEETTGLVKNDEEIKIHDDTSEGEMEYQSCLPLNGTGAIDDSNLVERRMVDFGSNGRKVVCPEITYLAGVFSSTIQADLAGKTSSRIEPEKVVETEEPSTVGNMNSINDKMDGEGSRTPVEVDQIKVQLEDANVTAAESIGEVIFNDLLNELGENIGLKRGFEIPLKTTEKLNATELSDGEGIALTEGFIKATEKQDHRAEINIVTSITSTPNITEIKWSSSSDTSTIKTPFGPAPQSQDKLCRAGTTVSIVGSEMCNQDEETSLVEDDKEILVQDDTVEGEIQYQPCLPLNETGAHDDALVEPRMVEFESTVNKVVWSEMTSEADVCSSSGQANLAGETSNLKLEEVLESEESLSGENVHYKSHKIEVEDDKNRFQECQDSMHLEDANMTAAEETSANDSSGKGMVQAESSVEINEKSDHNVSVEIGEKTIMEMQWSLSSHNTTLISPLRPEVGSQDMQGRISIVETAASSAGYGMCGHQKNEENVQIVKDDLEETINTETELFVGGKMILDEVYEGKFLADGVCHPLSDSTDRQCAKDKQNDISEGSFNNVSGGTQEKLICEVFDGPAADPVSSEEKDMDMFRSASHVDVSPQCIYNEKLPVNGCLPVSNHMQENSEVVCMDNRSLRNEIPAHFLSRLALEQSDNESEAAKAGAENEEVNARTFGNSSQALPSEELTAGTSSEHFSMRLNDHALLNGWRNCSAGNEIVMDQPFSKDFAAITDNNGTSASRERDVGQDDNVMEEVAISSLKFELGDHSGCKVDAELYDTNTSVIETIVQQTDIFGVVSTAVPEEMPNESIETLLPFEKGSSGDLDDQSEEAEPKHHCNSSIKLDGFTSAVGIIVDSNSKVGALRSVIANDLESGKYVEDPDVNGSGPYGVVNYISANTSEAAFMVEEVGPKDGGKTPVSHQRSLHGGKQEDIPSYPYTPCSKHESSLGSSILSCSSIPVSCENEELHPQVMDDIDGVGGTEISIDCKVAKEERDGCQINTEGFSDVIDGSLVEKSKGDPEEIAEAKSDDCEGSAKTATFMDGNNSLVVNQPLCLDESKSCDPETEEPNGLHLHDNIAGDSSEAGSCSKLDIVSSVKPEMVVDCSSISSICATSDKHKHFENPDESHILTNMEMSSFLAVEDEGKKPDAKAGDSNHTALDKTITECNSSGLKEEDYAVCSDVEDIKFSVKKDGPEDIEETTELRKDVSGLAAARADKSPLLKTSEVGAVLDHEEAFRSQLDLLSSQKKNVTAKKERSNSVFVKQFTSSILKSKSKSSLIQRTPKRLVIHDMKENEPSTKREQIGSRTTPKTSSKRRPLEHVWKY